MKRLVAKHDYGYRDYAIVYINGELIKCDKHYDGIIEYIHKNNLEKSNDLSLAFAHVNEIEHSVYLETEDFQNISMDEVVLTILKKFPGYSIYDDDSYRKLGGSPEEYIKIAKLLKRSELYNNYKNNDNIADFDVYVNPIKEEIEKIKKAPYAFEEIRGCLYNNNIYMWPAFVWHDMSEQVTNLNCDLRFVYVENHITIDVSVNSNIKTIEEIYNILLPYKNKLLSIIDGNINCKITGWEAEYQGNLNEFFNHKYEEIESLYEEYGIKVYSS